MKKQKIKKPRVRIIITFVLKDDKPFSVKGDFSYIDKRQAQRAIPELNDVLLSQINVRYNKDQKLELIDPDLDSEVTFLDKTFDVKDLLRITYKPSYF